MPKSTNVKITTTEITIPVFLHTVLKPGQLTFFNSDQISLIFVINLLGPFFAFLLFFALA